MAFGKRKSPPRTYTEAQLLDYAVGALGRRARTVAEIKRLMRTKLGQQPEAEQLVEAVTLRLRRCAT